MTDEVLCSAPSVGTHRNHQESRVTAERVKAEEGVKVPRQREDKSEIVGDCEQGRDIIDDDELLTRCWARQRYLRRAYKRLSSSIYIETQHNHSP